MDSSGYISILVYVCVPVCVTVKEEEVQNLRHKKLKWCGAWKVWREGQIMERNGKVLIIF